MSIGMNLVGSSGASADVKGPAVAPTTADPALVITHRPDDPVIAAISADSFITGQAGQINPVNNILAAVAGSAPVDSSNYRSVALQISPSGTLSGGAITFEGSNDQAYWVPILMRDEATPANAPVSSYTPATGVARFFSGNTAFRYFRVRISAAITGGGSVQAFAELMSGLLTPALPSMRLSNGSQQTPSMDAVARPGFQALTDGTTLVPVKAASTPPVATDAALVTTISPNLPVPTLHTLEAAATTNTTVAKASAGTLFAALISNVSASIRYLKLFNKAAIPTLGTDVPVATIAIPAGGNISLEWGMLGMRFGTGIAYAITGAAANADTTAIAANDVKVMLSYL